MKKIMNFNISIVNFNKIYNKIYNIINTSTIKPKFTHLIKI
jgi:hypothetical protein